MRVRLIFAFVAFLAIVWFVGPLVGYDPKSLWMTAPPPTPTSTAPVVDDEPSTIVAKLDVFEDQGSFEDGGLAFADQFTGTKADSRSLTDLKIAIDDRVGVGLSVLGGELNGLMVGEDSTKEELVVGRTLYQQFGQLAIYAGRLEEATLSFQRALKLAEFMDASTKDVLELHALLGIVALRRGEVANAYGSEKPQSVLFPTPPSGIQNRKEGSREAIHQFQLYLKDEPRDLRIRWLLNVAQMRIGGYPTKLPPEFLVPVGDLTQKTSTIRLENVTKSAGLLSAGPNLAGFVSFNDFDGDSLPDLFVGSLNTNFGPAFFKNVGGGTFEDQSERMGLEEQVYILNGTTADFDNDGRLDIFVVRGGNERPLRPSLLRNQGEGRFADVTEDAGLYDPIASETATWGDFDNDGWIDLFVAGEYYSPKAEASDSRGRPDPRNRCRLYHNEGNGTFRNVAETAGVSNLEAAKGAAWGDIDDDGFLDLFVANVNAPCRLYRNEGNGRFRDDSELLGVVGTERATSCWFWDFNNDGRIDLFVNNDSATVAEMVASKLGDPVNSSHRPSAYQNLGVEGFREVGEELGFATSTCTMGCNFADLDNDGYLDVFQSGGFMSLESFVPSTLLRNNEGQHFDDISQNANARVLQKSHSVAFADFDSDGDVDLALQGGGAVPGDEAYNLLFRNTGEHRTSLQIRLIGTKTNRAALGARIKATYQTSNKLTRTIYRTIGNNSSSGGNSLVESIGLDNAKQVDQIEIHWPVSKTTQVFKNIKGDQLIEITERTDAFKSVRTWSAAVKVP